MVELFQQLDQNPLPTSGDREVTEGLAFYGVIVPLYSRDSWSYLTQALQEAVDGKGDTLLLLADAYTERQPDGSYPNNALEVQSAVNCLDHPENETVQEIESNGGDFTAKAPVFGQAAMWWPYACSNWPVQPTEEQPDFSAKGAAPIVVVGTTRDPATPYEQSVKLADELDSGVLLSRDGDGHTAYGAGNTCIDDAINTYLSQGTPPTDGKEC
ncbi:MAG: alpha/beta hydrolase [Nocardioidaceae bacterium]